MLYGGIIFCGKLFVKVLFFQGSSHVFHIAHFVENTFRRQSWGLKAIALLACRVPGCFIENISSVSVCYNLGYVFTFLFSVYILSTHYLPMFLGCSERQVGGEG